MCEGEEKKCGTKTLSGTIESLVEDVSMCKRFFTALMDE